jgi:hypothetical protein
MGRRPRVIRPAELAYYRSHFLEALGDDAVVCLECGALLRDVKPHAWKLHGVTADQYRERWGYNRTNPLIVPSLSAKLRQMAFDQNLPAKAPRHSIDVAQMVRAQLHLPQRRERRLQHSTVIKGLVKAGKVPVFQNRVDDETLRSLAAENLSVRDMAPAQGSHADMCGSV